MSITLNDVGQFIAQSAPLLGGALAGPAGATIGSLIAAKFGGNSADPKALHTLINADPEAALKLKALELEHEFALQQLTFEQEKAEQQLITQDRASARQRETDVGKLPGENHDKTPAILAYLLTGTTILALTSLFCVAIPEPNYELISTLVSTLTTVWIGAMAYYHGSSASSRMKDVKLLQHLSQRPDENGETKRNDG